MDPVVIIYDALGNAHEVPSRLSGEDRLELDRATARRNALRPLEQLLDELQGAAEDLLELQRGMPS